MKISQHKQKGATLITWMLGISVGILIGSAALKLGPGYLEFNSVKSLMNNVAAEPGIENKNKREIMASLNRYLNINNLDSLSKAYSKDGTAAKKSPFTVVKLKKSNRRELAVEYEAKISWLGNLSFLMDNKYSVELGKQK